MLFDDENVRKNTHVTVWEKRGGSKNLKKTVKKMAVVPQRKVFHPRFVNEPKDWDVGVKVLLDEPEEEVQLLGFREE